MHLLFYLLVLTVFSQGCVPPNFPENLSFKELDYENWSKEITIPGLLVTEPRSAQDICELANWAKNNSYKLRPSGNQLSWSPITTFPVNRTSTKNVSPCKKTVLVKSRPHMTGISMAEKDDQGLNSVAVETGATLDEVLEFVGARGLSFGSMPSLATITIGALLALGDHGTGVPIGEKVPGKSTSTITNMVTELKVIVWNSTVESYQVQKIHRSDPRMRALLGNLGRIFITEATFRVGKDERYRALSVTNIPMSVLFANPVDNQIMTNSFAHFVNKTGHVGLLFFPYTDHAWLRLWYKSPKRLLSSKEVYEPYNYKFQEILPPEVLELGKSVLLGYNNFLTPMISELLSRAPALGLRSTATKDIWGWSRDVFRIVSTKAPKVSVSSFAVLTAYKNLQQVASEMYSIYDRTLNEYSKQGKFPMNAANEFRVTSVDNPEDVGIPGAEAPAFSPSSPLAEHPEFDTVIWMDLTTFSKTQHVSTFLEKIESEFYIRFSGDLAWVRPKWSTRFGYCSSTWSPWISLERMKALPDRFTNWKSAADTLYRLDPNGVFTNELFQSILP